MKTQHTNTKYTVSQTFETLGDPAASTHNTREEAEAAAEVLRGQLAEWIAGMETPDTYEVSPCGFSNEIAAWRYADETAGVRYDSAGNRTPDSPTIYGERAARQLAEQAVSIEEVE